MAHWVKLFAIKSDNLTSNLQNSHGRTREPTQANCPLTSTCLQWYMSSNTQINVGMHACMYVYM